MLLIYTVCYCSSKKASGCVPDRGRRDPRQRAMLRITIDLLTALLRCKNAGDIKLDPTTSTVDPLQEYVGLLRCQSWNTWPESTVIEYRFLRIDLGKQSPLPARLAVLSYEPRTTPHVYNREDTKRGPLVWDGAVPGLHLVRDAILKTPDEEVEVALVHRNAHRGEIDICVNFKFAGEPPVAVVDAVRSTASAVMSLLNLLLNDFLTPSAPFQVRQVLPGGKNQLDTKLWMQIQERHTVDRVQLEPVFRRVAQALTRSQYGPKLTTALELYAAHFTEKQARVRFLLLVVAMEALAKATAKHEVAVTLLKRWQVELNTEKSQHASDSEEWMSLNALERELTFRHEDSIRSQVRKLFAQSNGLDLAQRTSLQKRALHVYDRRSTLVHDGYLPGDELGELESEARDLLETLFRSAIAESDVASLSTSGV